MSLERITQSITARLHDFAALKACVRFDFGDDGAVVVDARSVPPVVASATAEADCTIRLSMDNAAKLLDGTLNPMLAYSMGKLKIDGSMGLAMKVAALLDD